MSAATLPLAPAPHRAPVLGHLIDAQRDPLGLFMEGMRTGDPVCRYRFGPYRALLINEPEGIEYALVQNPKAYIKSPMYHGLRVVLGNGLVTSEGSLWRRQRKLVSPAFHHRRLVRFTEVMSAATEDLIREWSTHPARTPFNLHEVMMRLTFRIVGLTLFSTDLTDDAQDMGHALEFLLDFANDYAEDLVRIPLWLPTLRNIRFRKNMRVVDNLIARIMTDRRRHHTKEDDLLSMLMEATDGEGAMHDRQLRDELVTLALAGHETTSNALSFTWRQLSQHPGVARRVQEEVDEVIGDRRPSFEDLARLTYTEAVIKESMRLYPPVWAFDREAIEPDEILGHRVEPKTMVMFVPYTLHRDPKLWSNPEGFDPDRFIDSAPAHRFAYVPFGGGPRVCIGNAFAMMEAKIIVAMLARRFDVDLVPGAPFVLNPGVTLRPKHGIMATLRSRVV